MNWYLLNIVIGLIGFFIYVNIQSIIIIGIYECFQKEMIFYPIREYLSKYINKTFQKPLWGCCKCASSFWGFITYLPVVYLFGLRWQEIPLFIADVFCLVYLNYQFYKKI